LYTAKKLWASDNSMSAGKKVIIIVVEKALANSR
jgi:hypothetical protein